MEYVFSPEGQNTWLKGFAAPVLLPTMVKNGTVDQAALAAIGAPSQAPVQLTADQTKAATDLPDRQLEVHHHQVAQTADRRGPHDGRDGRHACVV